MKPPHRMRRHARHLGEVADPLHPLPWPIAPVLAEEQLVRFRFLVSRRKCGRSNGGISTVRRPASVFESGIQRKAVS